MPELRRISARVTVRKGTSTQWELTNPVLLDGEIAYITNTRMLKIGDGTTPFKELPLFEGAGSGVKSQWVHDGNVFPDAVKTGEDALYHSQKQINKWNACAEQDFEDGYNGTAVSCVSDGSL
jgi:hypothetical protein